MEVRPRSLAGTSASWPLAMSSASARTSSSGLKPISPIRLIRLRPPSTIPTRAPLRIDVYSVRRPGFHDATSSLARQRPWAVWRSAQSGLPSALQLIFPTVPLVMGLKNAPMPFLARRVLAWQATSAVLCSFCGQSCAVELFADRTSSRPRSRVLQRVRACVCWEARWQAF
jgi:hypothetical protein